MTFGEVYRELVVKLDGMNTTPEEVTEVLELVWDLIDNYTEATDILDQTTTKSLAKTARVLGFSESDLERTKQ